MNKQFIAIVIGSLCVACNSLQYSEPQAGERARVRFATTSESVTVLFGYGDNQCNEENELMRLRNGPLLNSSPKKLGIPLWAFNDNAAKEVYVAADRPFNAMFKGQTLTSATYRTHTWTHCGAPFSVTFKANHDYEVKFEEQRCVLEVNEIIANSRVPVDATFNDNPNCRAAFEKVRAY